MEQRRWRIGEVAERTGLTVRTLRYYEEIGLVDPSGRLPGGHRYYSDADLVRLDRVCLLRQLGTSLADIARLVDDPDRTLEDAVREHLHGVDGRLQALGRHRERVVALLESVADDPPPDADLVAALADGDGGQMDAGLRQRITLLVYDDIEAAHDYLVTMFGFGPGRLSRDDAGRVVHGEMHVGDGVLWLHPASEASSLASPASLGAATHCMAVMVDDVDEHHRRTAAAGVRIDSPPRDMPYGVREYDARDCEGGLWSFMSPLEDATEEEGDRP